MMPIHYDDLGKGDEFRAEKFLKLLKEFFGENPLYVAITRGKSFLPKISQIPTEILPFLGKKENSIMNKQWINFCFLSYRQF